MAGPDCTADRAAVVADRVPILVVEDEVLISQAICDMLALDGRFAVIGVAETVGRALALAEAHRPVIALVDVKLKGGDGSVGKHAGKRDGIDLAADLCNRFQVRCIIVTGSGDPVTLARIQALVGVDLLCKPFRSAQLMAAVERAAVAAGRLHPEQRQ
jgi:two-component system, response regulator PdtaR